MGTGLVRPLRGFVSYATADHEAVDRLLTLLQPVEKALGLVIWRHTGIAAGSQWDAEIMNAIGRADVFIVCMSPFFLASRYCYEVELPAIHSRTKDASALMMPVLLAPCAWWGSVGDWPVLPTQEGKTIPISDWRSKEKALIATASQIRHAIEVHLGLVAEAPASHRAPPLVPNLDDLNDLGEGKLSPAEIQMAVEALVAEGKANSGV